QSVVDGHVTVRNEVDGQVAVAFLRERDSEVERRSRLRHPALLVGERNHGCHGSFLRNGVRLRLTCELKEAHCAASFEPRYQSPARASDPISASWSASRQRSSALWARSVPAGSARTHSSASASRPRTSSSSTPAGAPACSSA